jgi:hypothetical protein
MMADKISKMAVQATNLFRIAGKAIPEISNDEDISYNYKLKIKYGDTRLVETEIERVEEGDMDSESNGLYCIAVETAVASVIQFNDDFQFYNIVYSMSESIDFNMSVTFSSPRQLARSDIQKIESDISKKGDYGVGMVKLLSEGTTKRKR